MSAMHSPRFRCFSKPGLTALLCTQLFLAAGSAQAQDGADNTAQISVANGQRYEVWADVLFGPDGRNLAFHLPNEAELPAAFADLVKHQLQSARIQAVKDSDGSPATFRTGVRLNYQLLPAAQAGEVDQVKLLGLSMAPLPVKRYMASYPRELLRTPGWEGGVQASCHVSPEGLCHKVDVQMLPGMPESVRRFAKASFEGWSFEAQRVNDRPVEGQISIRFSLHTRELYARNFRIPAFERAILNR